MSASSAATFQQGFVSAIVELLIAAALALPELFRSEGRSVAPSGTADENSAMASEPLEASAIMKRRPMIASVAVNDLPRLTPAAAQSTGLFMLACLERASGGEAAAGAIYARYRRWCEEQTPATAALDPSAFAEQFASRCARAGIRTRQNGNRVYCLDIQLVA
jgi:hypothetical protein